MREVGIGVVVRNETGKVLVLEAIATRWAVQFISKLGISQSVFEGDSEVFCNSLFTENSSLSFLVILLKKLHLWRALLELIPPLILGGRAILWPIL